MKEITGNIPPLTIAFFVLVSSGVFGVELKSLKSLVQLEKTSRHLEEQLTELQTKLDDSQRQFNDCQLHKSRLQSENASLISQCEEHDLKLEAMNRSRQQLNVQIEEARSLADEEARAKSTLLVQFKNLRNDYDAIKSRLDDEVMSRGELQRKLTHAVNEVGL